ncbi:DUF2516 family protein [Actinacidiphila sp. ITFR-21]|uniref:DUF2516 family protein n=1 Tax=Actinacidiphila sp. ITFR-21 TaxID=3075199 RepID=UPI00288B2783|nr:DUF2516 family protein [Streptomyces sp. ITFR-21]WNI17032.1 DUF2516 family protein [Streptomyces sp. ITFR-21]
MLITGFYSVLGLVSWALLLFALFAFVDAAFRRPDAYRAADKKSKTFWLVVLGLAAVVMKFFSLVTILPLIGLVAVIVYMVDVRPAIRGITGVGGGRPRGRLRRGGGGGGGGSSSDGPYGPYNGRR